MGIRDRKSRYRTEGNGKNNETDFGPIWAVMPMMMMMMMMMMMKALPDVFLSFSYSLSVIHPSVVKK